LLAVFIMTVARDLHSTSISYHHPVVNFPMMQRPAVAASLHRVDNGIRERE
jgi:hypothetical protein